jgi:ribose 5-phosphate isomerase A
VSGAPTSATTLDAVVARALELTREAAVIGLGSGRAAEAFLDALAVQSRAGRRVRGVPSSEATARRARERGVELAVLGDVEVDATVDGADEVDPDLDLLKGYGGAFVRERVVAAASRRQIILVGPEKLVSVLGARGRLPVEVVPFALPLALPRLAAIAGRPTVRAAGERPALSDNGNVIVDCAVGPIRAARTVHEAVRGIPGVVDTGLFLGTADVVLVAEPGGVREWRRGERRR